MVNTVHTWRTYGAHHASSPQSENNGRKLSCVRKKMESKGWENDLLVLDPLWHLASRHKNSPLLYNDEIAAMLLVGDEALKLDYYRIIIWTKNSHRTHCFFSVSSDNPYVFNKKIGEMCVGDIVSNTKSKQKYCVTRIPGNKGHLRILEPIIK